ncbi:MAG: hypothetical protein ACLGJA_04860 [Gammaproteobacteria bacterium]|jgi:hypothetical protein
MPSVHAQTPRELSVEELDQVAGGLDATIMPVFPPVSRPICGGPDVPPPHLPRYPDVPPPNDIRGPTLGL